MGYWHLIITLLNYHTNGLKIPKGYLEAVNQRTKNTMSKRNGQTMIYKTLHRKLQTLTYEYAVVEAPCLFAA